MLGTLTFHQQPVNNTQHILAGVARDRFHYVFQNFGRNRAHQPTHDLGAQRRAAAGDGLVHDAERVSHRTVARLGQQRQRVVVCSNVLLRGNTAQLRNDVVEAHRMKAEVLAARADRLGNVLRLRRGHHEDDVAGRLLQRLQQRIKRGIGDLVRLVEDVNLEAIARRAITGGLAQLANLVDATVGGGVNLDDIHRVAGSNLAAGIAHAARLRHRMVLRLAIQRHGENAGDRRLADTTVSAEDVAVRDPSLLNGVLQGSGDVLLPDDVGEFLRPVFARQDLITHGRKTRLYGLRLWNARRRWSIINRHCGVLKMQGLTLLQTILERLPARLNALPSAQVERKPSPDAWSPKEEFGHLLDSAANNHQRIVRAQLEDKPAMPGYDGERWVVLHRYQQRDWQSLIQLWAGSIANF